MKISEIRNVCIAWYEQLISHTSGLFCYILDEDSIDTFRGCWNYCEEQINLDGQLTKDSYVVQDNETGEKIIFHEDCFEIFSKVESHDDQHFKSSTLNNLYVSLFDDVPNFPEWDIYEKYFIKQEDGTFRLKDDESES